MPTPELLPCPFCGGKAEIETYPLMSYASCLDCTADTKGINDSEAVAAWNRRAPGWLPIESAPKDGSRILACNANAGTFHIVSWNAAYEEWFTPEDRTYDPTHWQPLPAAPEE